MHMNIKIFFGLFVMMSFLLASAAVFADNDTLSDDAETTRTVGPQERIQQRQDARAERVERVQERVAQVQDRIAQAREAWGNAKERYEAHRADYQELLGEARECRKNNNCEDVRASLLEKSIEVVQTSAERTINHLEEVKQRVDGSELRIKEDIIADIDAKIAELERLSEDVGQATTKQEVQEAARAIRAVWQEFNTKSKMYIGFALHNQMGNIIERAEHLETQLEARIETSGIDTSLVADDLADFHEAIALAKEKHAQALSVLEDGYTSQDEATMREAVQEAKSLLREAKDHLRDARDALISIVRIINAEGVSLEEAE